MWSSTASIVGQRRSWKRRADHLLDVDEAEGHAASSLDPRDQSPNRSYCRSADAHRPSAMSPSRGGLRRPHGAVLIGPHSSIRRSTSHHVSPKATSCVDKGGPWSQSEAPGQTIDLTPIRWPSDGNRVSVACGGGRSASRRPQEKKACTARSHLRETRLQDLCVAVGVRPG